MPHDENPQRDGQKQAKPKKQASPDQANNPFDLWLNRGLHQLFDDVAQEPVPDELLNLINQDRKAP